MTKDGVTTSYKYNELNQLTSSVESKGGKETSNKTYTYDVNGTKEVVNQENLYNGNGKRIQKKEGNNVVNYFYQDGVVLYTTDNDGNKTSQNFIGTDGNIIGTTRYSSEGYKYYTYNKDVQGSTTSVVGQDGTSPVTYDYDDFGVTTTIGDSSFFNEVCYTGGIYDVSTGLYYLNARYYDPNNGRFITQDTYRGELNEPDTLHLYVYCVNNPINYVDPSGHVPFAIPIGIGLSKAFISKLLYTGGAIIVSGAAVVVGQHIKNKKYDHYVVELRNYRVYFGNGISRSKAVSRLKRGKNVWSKSASKAKSIAKSASPVKKVESKSEIHFTAEYGKRKLKYAYWHYHYLKKNKKDRGNGHSFYGDEKKNPNW